ncbi:putative arylformamidase [Habropoda laboriosa]|uniref:Putative arylformamidase n=2 Tax=Habropoda laboriosa TaxID=597456 RepID=A0A0L7R3B9_9HYME|nr:putative arylformamidase [Habropoda laboriosa]
MHYYTFAKEITANARKNLKCELDVPYAATERTKYDIYGTDLSKDAPIFVFVHGGYWQEGSKDMAAFAAPVFVRKGIKVITIGYDLCPNVKLRDIIYQVKTAVEHILKYASSLGCRNIWVSGHSAGAHLAASLLFDELWLDKMIEQGHLNLLKGIVLIGGVYNLKPLVDTNISTTLKLTKDEIDAYSFTTLNTKNNTPIQQLKVIVTAGQCDSPGLINESRECAQKLLTMVDHVEYIFLRENIDHFDIVEKLTKEEFVLTKVILSNILHE